MNVPARNTEPALKELPEGYDSGNQSLAVSLAMAEVDQQVTTAHAYPRSVDHAIKNIMTLATLDEETAVECIYALPRGGKPIKGPSIRLAEMIQSQWGNNRVGTRIVHVDRIEKYVEAEGVFHDLETNAATTARVRRRISDKQGRLFNDDMIIVTGNAASAIAKRNAILAGVPKAVWRRAYSAVEHVLVGDIKTLVERRAEAIKAFAAFGVTPEQIFTALEINGLDDIGLEEITVLLGMHSALKSGEASVEEMFPAGKPKAEKPGDLKSRLDQLADDGVAESVVGTDAATAPEQTVGGGAATGEVHPVTSPGDGSGGSPTLSSAAAAPATDAIERILKLVTDKATTDQEKLENLELLKPAFEHLTLAFQTMLFATAKKVVLKELTPVAAKKYLEQVKG